MASGICLVTNILQNSQKSILCLKEEMNMVWNNMKLRK